MGEHREHDGSTVTHGMVTADIGADTVRRFHLTVIEGPQTGTAWRSESDVCAIGSHARCHMIIDDPTVSRFHCEIRMDQGAARLRDTGSRNGTVVDGVRIIESYVRSGSTIRLGRTVLRFELGLESNRLRMSSNTRFGLLAGQSTRMRQVFAYLERAAATDATLLLEGETGTGKTAAARSVHQESQRREGPFVMVDCGAIPATLLESELFGHEKGAFTGAGARRIGAFEEASGGTLFLDEIGELPADLQPKLLGALENRTVRRLGANAMVPIDVRVIAATNRDLRTEINTGGFRSDLYFRLAVIKVEMPALRQRPEDMDAVARQVLSSLGADQARIDALLAPQLIEQLRGSAWPGNIRELKNYLERCLVFDDVMPLENTPADDDGMPVYASLPYADAKQRALGHFERAYLEELLRRHDGKVADAAQAAEIDRTYFYRLLRRHGLNK